MAYTFDRIDSLFSRPQEDKTDVFSGKGQVTGNYGIVKTNVGGNLADTGTGAATNAGGESAAPQNIIAPTSAAIKRNVAKAQTPQTVNRIGQDLTSAQQKLQQEANQYVQNYQNQNYGVNEADIESAVAGGNQAKLGDIAQRYAKKNYGAVNQFNPLTDTDIEDVQLLGSEGGVKRLLGREAGSSYTPGEGAFDVSLLRRNKDFNLIADQLQRQQKALSGETSGLKTSKTTEAQAEADKRYADATAALESSLKGREAANIGAATQAASDVNARRAALRQQADQDFIEKNKQAALEAAKRDVLAYNPRAERFFNELNINPLDYYSVGGDVGYQDVLTPEQASQFNRIQDILGTGGSMQAGAGPGADEAFNQLGLQNYAVNESLARRNQEDKKQQDLINQLQNAARTRAQQYNVSREDATNKAFKDKQIQIMAELAGIPLETARQISEKGLATPSSSSISGGAPINANSLSIPTNMDGFGGIAGGAGGGGDFQNILSQMNTGGLMNTGSLSIDTPTSRYMRMMNSGLKPQDYADLLPEVYAEQAYTPEEAEQLNRALEDLGSFAPRAAANKGFAAPTIREEALRNALRGYL